jgi:hypothetical protein
MAALALILGAFWFIWTLLLWYKLHPHLPWRDMFVILDGLSKQPNFLTDWQALIEPHYAAHRIAVPRLLVALDLRLLDGQSHALYASAWIGLLSCLGILFYTARDYFEHNPSSGLFYAGIAVTLMFAPAHLWNLVNAINASWHITFACAFVAFYILVRRPEPPGAGAWIMAYLFATIAAFTTIAGVIVWLLLPVLAIRCSRVTLTITVLISVLLATVYSIGLSSDADIAVAWKGDNTEVIEKIKAAGIEAKTNNTLTVIVSRTLRVLTWPLSSEKSITGALLVSLSLCVLAFSGVRFLRSEFQGQDAYHPWVKLCLMASVLALGIALAIQFGRLIEQPNHADGPSFERYNTVGAIYWIGIMGLALSTLNYLGNLHRLLLMGSCLTIAALLIYPKGDYLQQEVMSMEHASRLYASGENPELRRPAGRKMSRIKPEYVFHFDPYFQEKELAYLAPGEPPYAPEDSSLDCPTSSMKARYRRSDIKGYKTLEVSLGAAQSMITRDILIYSERKFLARLHQSHADNYNPLELARPSSNVFTGQILSKEAHMGLLTLVANSLGPNLFHCRMPNTIVGS